MMYLHSTLPKEADACTVSLACIAPDHFRNPVQRTCATTVPLAFRFGEFVLFPSPLINYWEDPDNQMYHSPILETTILELLPAVSHNELRVHRTAKSILAASAYIRLVPFGVRNPFKDLW